jgi:hypothetical protein
MNSKTASKPSNRLTPGWILRIELLDITPTVWRRVLVPPTIRLPVLHRVFQTALGWTNSHLHEFVIGGQRYSTNDPDMIAELNQKDERRVVLEKALGHEARCFDYVYDFGDDWHHVVLLDERYARLDPAAPMRCLDGENACPPDDVGGPHGYAEFLNAVADPKHEEHTDFLAWVGGRFDPSHFDRAAVNAALAKIKV